MSNRIQKSCSVDSELARPIWRFFQSCFDNKFPQSSCLTVDFFPPIRPSYVNNSTQQKIQGKYNRCTYFENQRAQPGMMFGEIINKAFGIGNGVFVLSFLFFLEHVESSSSVMMKDHRFRQEEYFIPAVIYSLTQVNIIKKQGKNGVKQPGVGGN